MPSRELLPERLQAVLGVVYLVFNEGYASTEGDGLVRTDLCSEAIRLGRLLVELMPEEPEAQGLLALMLLHDARRATRIDAAGALIPLEEQDRSRWQRDAIAEGLAVLEAALHRRRRGPYQLQAAIAALHAEAERADATDWEQIAVLYAGLLSEQPSPVVELNAAVALAMARGPEQGLAWIERLEQGGELAGYHLLPAARADLLRRLGRLPEAAVVLSGGARPGPQPGRAPVPGTSARRLRAGRAGLRDCPSGEGRAEAGRRRPLPMGPPSRSLAPLELAPWVPTTPFFSMPIRAR